MCHSVQSKQIITFLLSNTNDIPPNTFDTISQNFEHNLLTWKLALPQIVSNNLYIVDYTYNLGLYFAVETIPEAPLYVIKRGYFKHPL